MHIQSCLVRPVGERDCRHMTTFRLHMSQPTVRQHITLLDVKSLSTLFHLEYHSRLICPCLHHFVSDLSMFLSIHVFLLFSLWPVWCLKLLGYVGWKRSPFSQAPHQRSPPTPTQQSGRGSSDKGFYCNCTIWPLMFIMVLSVNSFVYIHVKLY